RPCALVSRAGPLEGECEAAAESAARLIAGGEGRASWLKSREIRHSVLRFDLPWCEWTGNRRWRCNFDQTANIALRPCRRSRWRRASALTNAPSALSA